MGRCYFFMEQKHKNRLMAEYGRIIAFKPLHILDVPDDYLFMDTRLIEIFKDIVPGKLGLTAQK